MVGSQGNLNIMDKCEILTFALLVRHCHLLWQKRKTEPFHTHTFLPRTGTARSYREALTDTSVISKCPGHSTGSKLGWALFQLPTHSLKKLAFSLDFLIPCTIVSEMKTKLRITSPYKNLARELGLLVLLELLGSAWFSAALLSKSLL